MYKMPFDTNVNVKNKQGNPRFLLLKRLYFIESKYRVGQK